MTVSAFSAGRLAAEQHSYQQFVNLRVTKTSGVLLGLQSRRDTLPPAGAVFEVFLAQTRPRLSLHI